MTRVYSGIAVGLVAFLLAAMAVLIFPGVPQLIARLTNSGDVFADCRTSVVAGGAAAIGGPFTLMDHNGQLVSEADVITGPTLVYFGYSYCPDVCPLDNARNAEAVDLLKAKGLDVRPVFVSVDPDRDTPAVMGEFVSYMHPDMIGLTGTADQIKAAAKAYKVYYRKVTEEEHYLVDHSTFTYLMAPEHGFLDFYKRAQTPQEVAQSVACYASKL